MTQSTGPRSTPEQARRHIKIDRIASLPPELRDVALVDARTAAATAGISETHWRDLIREGVAPQPAFTSRRFTRWRMADVVEFWRSYRGPDGSRDRVREAARKASQRAQERRHGRA
jgi:predicted DNA-binding transcriptional regulator AlpA